MSGQRDPREGFEDGAPDLELLRRLHVVEGLSARQIASRTDLSAYRIRVLLTAHGWYRSPGTGGRPLAVVDQAQLRKLLIDEGLSSREVAHRLGVSRAVVTRHANRLRVAGYRPAPRPPAPSAPNLEQLIDLFTEDRLTLRELAQRSGRTYAATRQELESAGVPIRRGARRKARTSVAHDELVEAVKKSYDHPQASMVAVGEQVGVSVATVRRALHATGTPTRHRIGDRAPLSDDRSVLLDDLLADALVVGVLRELGIPTHKLIAPDTPQAYRRHIVPPEHRGTAVRRLYSEAGLAAFHVSLLLALSPGSVMATVKRAGVEPRPPGVLSPFEARRRRTQP